jgi:hypothetical protein
MINLDTLIRDLCDQVCNSEELVEEWKNRGFVCPDVERAMPDSDRNQDAFYNTVVNSLMSHERRYGIECPDFFVVNGNNRAWHDRRGH